MNLRDALIALRTLAPESLAESWDKPGLQVGQDDWPIRRALLTIDLTSAVLAEALRARCHLIVSYHPPIFDPLPALTAADWRQRLILHCAQHRIAVYSPHTALDAAVGGVNDWLAAGLGKGHLCPLHATASPATPPTHFKLVVFVPARHADALRHALSAAGAGIIANYTECSFAAPGEGTFRGGPGSHPAIGRPGRLERVPELRLEMLVPAHRLADVVAALRAAHPYEKPAFDIYPLHAPPPDHHATASPGAGRLLELAKPLSLPALVQRVKQHLSLRHVELVAPPRPRPIFRIGLAAGAGGSLLAAAEAAGAQAFLTGEMRHHDLLAAQQRGLAVILAGHTQTERPYLPVYRRRLQHLLPTVSWRLSRADAPPSQPR